MICDLHHTYSLQYVKTILGKYVSRGQIVDEQRKICWIPYLIGNIPGASWFLSFGLGSPPQRLRPLISLEAAIGFEPVNNGFTVITSTVIQKIDYRLKHCIFAKVDYLWTK
jgi:hypothetical protein